MSRLCHIMLPHFHGLKRTGSRRQGFTIFNLPLRV